MLKFISHFHTFLEEVCLFNMNLSFLACSMHFMFTDWAIVYVPVLALYYVIASFICITNQSTHFLHYVFFFLFFFLLFKQIKRFLLNIQAIVSPPSHDFALSPLHAACLLRCVCRVSLCSRRLGLLTPCVSTWGWMRAAFCVACLSVLLCQLASRSARTRLTFLSSLLMSVVIHACLVCWLSVTLVSELTQS